jgi:hypothetical protein
MRKPRGFVPSPEDRATYAKWRRGVAILYGSVILAAIIVVVALWLEGR